VLGLVREPEPVAIHLTALPTRRYTHHAVLFKRLVSPAENERAKVPEIGHLGLDGEHDLFFRPVGVHGDDDLVERAREGEEEDVACLAFEVGAVLDDCCGRSAGNQ
jgi:hypothetical protein